MKPRIWPRATFVTAVATLTACGGRTVDLGDSLPAADTPPAGDYPPAAGDSPPAAGLGDDAPKDILVGRQNGAVAVFVDDQRVYWLTRPENQLAPPGLFRSCLKDHCESTIVTYVTSPQPDESPFPVAIDSAHVYWEEREGDLGLTAVKSCPSAGLGRSRRRLSPISMRLLACKRRYVPLLDLDSGDIRLPVQSRQLPGDAAGAGPDSGKRSEPRRDRWVRLLGVRGRGVRFDPPRRVATDGMSPVETLTSGQNQTGSLSVREPYVYLTNSDSIGSVLRCPVAGRLFGRDGGRVRPQFSDQRHRRRYEGVLDQLWTGSTQRERVARLVRGHGVRNAGDDACSSAVVLEHGRWSDGGRQPVHLLGGVGCRGRQRRPVRFPRCGRPPVPK